MRLFIAIELPKQLNKQISEIKEKLNTEDAKTTIIKENHLTLKFLGEIEEIDKIKEALNTIELKQYKTKLSNIGVFPNENYIKIVWIGIDPEEETKKLKQEIDKALKDFNFKEDFEFHPHITLARVKFIKDKPKFKELINSLKTEDSEFEIKEFKLIKSELILEGPVYTELAAF